jgi:hypothetical protein
MSISFDYSCSPNGNPIANPGFLTNYDIMPGLKLSPLLTSQQIIVPDLMIAFFPISVPLKPVLRCYSAKEIQE